MSVRTAPKELQREQPDNGSLCHLHIRHLLSLTRHLGLMSPRPPATMVAAIGDLRPSSCLVSEKLGDESLRPR